jgi:segregation and condensation protein A
MTSTTQDYRVQLDAYAGPLDLLLYLVKRHEIDLYDIPVAELTEQYLHHLKVIQSIDVELAGEFLVMAATLLEVKSQMLVPFVTEDSDEEVTDTIEDPADPRYELVQQLLAYKRFKDAAIDLEERQREWDHRFPAHPTARPAETNKAHTDDTQGPDNAQPIEIDLEDANVLDLCEAFGRILDSIGQTPKVDVTYDDTPISLHAEDIADRLKRDGPMTLQKIFEGRAGRGELVGLFLAVLELVRMCRVRVIQDGTGGEIRLESRPESEHLDPSEIDADAGPTDWSDPQTGQVQYDWPDEPSRLRAERRAQLRGRRSGAGGSGRSAETGREDDLPVDDDPPSPPTDSPTDSLTAPRDDPRDDRLDDRPDERLEDEDRGADDSYGASKK